MSGIAIVQTSARATYPGSGGSGTTSSTSLTGVTGGNLLVTLNDAAGAPTSSAPNISVSDGTAYALGAANYFNYTATNYTMASIHYLANAGSGSHTTVSTNNNSGAFDCYGYTRTVEVSGCLTVSPLDTSIGSSGAVTNSNTNTTVTTGSSGSFAQAAEIVFAVYSTGGGSNITPSEPSGFTNIDSNTVFGTFSGFAMGSMDYDIISATTAINASWGASAGGSFAGWSAAMCAFKAVSSVVFVAPNLDGNVNGRLNGGLQ